MRVDERWFRGYLEEDAGHYVLNLGARWMCRNTDLEDGAEVKVTIQPEGDEIAGLSSDIRAAIEAESEALSFFETVAPFYRRNYIRWIESAKRPETRQARIAEAVRKLKAGEKRE